MTASRLSLDLPGRSIPVIFDNESADWAAREIAGICSPGRKVMVVTDERVSLLYGDGFIRSLQEREFAVSQFAFVPGERRKTLSTVASLVDCLAQDSFTRTDVIVGLGGGVVTDIAGFAAAIYARGVSWYAVPTSLMGMVDAAIGGKTGVDHVLGKNLIGAFHQPLAVFSPLRVLDTLDAREWLSGSAEVVKSALISGGELWDLVLERGPDLRPWPREEAYRAIVLSAQTKIDIVARDEKEGSVRRILNLGHTFGHALEAITGYALFTHGEAVFLGLRAAAHLSKARGLLKDAETRTIDDLLSQVSLPSASTEPHSLLAALDHDKKLSSGRLHWILLQGIGRSVIDPDVPASLVEETAEWLCGVVGASETASPRVRPPRILVINGPNLNLLGEREPSIYGAITYSELEGQLVAWARDLNMDVLVRQSNVEGEMVYLIQLARHWADGIVINSGGYTHTSVAIRDAISAVNLPAIEVHISDISQREEFRRTSLIAPVCIAQISGQGIEGYRQALKKLAAVLSNSASVLMKS
jgi:3-dehydroquinate synthase